jgi:hypothetical protein
MPDTQFTEGPVASAKGEKSLNIMNTDSNLDASIYKNIGKNADSIRILESNDDDSAVG